MAHGSVHRPEVMADEDDDDHIDQQAASRHSRFFHGKKNPSTVRERALKILAGLLTIVTLAVFGLSMAINIVTDRSEIYQRWSILESSRALAIVGIISALLHAPQVLLVGSLLVQFLAAAVNCAMTIVLFVFATRMFADGWPGDSMCRRWVYDPPSDDSSDYYKRGHFEEGSWRCRFTIERLQSQVIAVGTLAYVAAFIVFIMLVVRVIELSKRARLPQDGLAGAKGAKDRCAKWMRGAVGVSAAGPGDLNGKSYGFTISFNITLRRIGQQDQQYQPLENAGVARVSDVEDAQAQGQARYTDATTQETGEVSRVSGEDLIKT